MKQILTRWVALFAVALVATAFVVNNQTEDDIVIGLTMGDVGQARWIKDRQYIEQTVKGMGGEVVTKVANHSVEQQIEDIRALMAQEVDVMIVVPFDSRRLEKVLQEVRDKGIKVLAYDRLVMDADVDYYVSYNNERVGELQTEYLINKKPRGEYLLIQGPASDHNSELFYRGQANVLSKSSNVRVMQRARLKNWSGEEGEQIVSNYLATHKVPACIIAPNDDVARGAIRALSDVDGSEGVLITGQDADLASCKQIVAGRQAMTVYKPIKPLAYEAAFTAIRMARKEPVFNITDSLFNGRSSVPSVILAPFPVDAENIANVIDDGHFSREALYGK